MRNIIKFELQNEIINAETALNLLKGYGIKNPENLIKKWVA